MKIFLKSLHLENFKGIKNLDVNFQTKQRLKDRMQQERQPFLMRSHGFCLTRTVPERKSLMLDLWIRTETELIT